MNWLFATFGVKPPNLKEPLVDCDNCQLKSPLKRTGIYQVDRKCCEFSPYWSSFGIGAWLDAGNTLGSLKAVDNGEMILTSIGVIHTLEHRAGKENLCLNFNKQNNNCSIWSQRPATCFSFFCASQYETGISQYSILEDWLLSIESAAIKIYFYKNGIAPEVWQKWVEYMEEEPDPETFPHELLIHNYSDAEKLYKDSYYWFRDSHECEVLRFQVREDWKKQMAENPQLC